MARPKSNTAQIIAAICACITVMVLLHNQFGNPDKTSSSDTTNSERKTNQTPENLIKAQI